MARLGSAPRYVPATETAAAHTVPAAWHAAAARHSAAVAVGEAAAVAAVAATGLRVVEVREGKGREGERVGGRLGALGESRAGRHASERDRIPTIKGGGGTLHFSSNVALRLERRYEGMPRELSGAASRGEAIAHLEVSAHLHGAASAEVANSTARLRN